MTTYLQISGNPRAPKKAPLWSPLGKTITAGGPRASRPNGAFPQARKFQQDAWKVIGNLQPRNAAEDLALAAHIHSELMSIKLPSVAFASMKGKTIPCRAIGGDFFDAIALPDALCAVVADVSGKGAPAAIVAAMLQGIIHAQMLADQPLPAIATMVNEFLCSRTTGKFATMVLLKVHAAGRVEYVNCGHVPPVLFSKSVRKLEGGNSVVGLFPGTQYELQTSDLSPEDRILIFTDGISEAENAQGEQFGDAGCDSWAHLRSVDAVLDQASRFQGSVERSDDWTLLELLYRGESARRTFEPSNR
jgi:phosphoserine phosphatase RsbU/P